MDPVAREAGQRWGREIERGLGEARIELRAETGKARAEIDDTTRDRTMNVKVDVDRSELDRAFGGGSGGGGGGFGSGVGFGGGGLSPLKLNVGLVGIGLLPAAATAIADVAGALQQLAGAGVAVPGIFAGLASSVGTAKLGMQGMSDAFDAVNKAADGTQASVDAANKALAELSPNAAETVKTVAGLKGTFTDLRDIASENMFAGVSEGLRALVGNLLPAATQGIDSISRGLNENLLQAMTSLGSDSSQGFLSRILGNTGEAQSRLTAAIEPAVQAIERLTAAGSDSLPRLADAVGRVAERFNAFITNADASGNLDKWINDGLTGFSQLGNIMLNLGKSFTAITQAAGGGTGLLGTLQSATEHMATFLNSAQGQAKLADFFAQGRESLRQLRDIAMDLGPILSEAFQAGINAANFWLPTIRDILDTINGIPGGASAVVGAFVAWKTIQGPISLANAILNVGNQLGGLPGKAQGAVAGINSALAMIVVPAIGKTLNDQLQQFLQQNAPDLYRLNNSGTPDQAGKWARDWWDRNVSKETAPAQNGVLPTAPGSSPNATVGGIPIPGLVNQNPMTPAGSAPSAAPSLSRGAIDRQHEDVSSIPLYPGGPTAPALPAPAVSVPAVSSYTPPMVTAPAGGGSSTTPNLPYAGTADPYAYTGAMAPTGIDAMLLANVPAGRYTQSERGDLTQGLADCSSAVEDLVNMLQGRPTAGASMATGNAADWLTARGFIPGSGGPGDFRVGFNSGHMQATLPDGTPFNWGSNDAAARRGIGGTGADDPAFTSHYYLPASRMMPATAGQSPTGALGANMLEDSSVRNAREKVMDTQHAAEQAQARLNEVRAKGTATNRELADAEYDAGKAAREHNDAIADLATTERKAAENAQKKSTAAKSSGSSAGEDLGGDIFSGLLEMFGFDGSFLKDPTQFGLFKLFKGVMGLKPAGDGSTGGAAPAGGGGGLLGSILGGVIPQPFGALNTGSPQDAPGQFMPLMPGGGGGSVNIPALAASGQTGAPGPGNGGDYSINFNGPVGNPQQAMDAANTANIPRMRQGVRNLPQ